MLDGIQHLLLWKFLEVPTDWNKSKRKTSAQRLKVGACFSYIIDNHQLTILNDATEMYIQARQFFPTENASARLLRFDKAKNRRKMRSSCLNIRNLRTISSYKRHQTSTLKHKVNVLICTIEEQTGEIKGGITSNKYQIHVLDGAALHILALVYKHREKIQRYVLLSS